MHNQTLSEACNKCKCLSLPLRDPIQRAGWKSGLRVFIRGSPQAILLPVASGHPWRDSVLNPFILAPVVGPDDPQSFSEGLWFFRVSGSQALGTGGQGARWQEKYERGRRQLGSLNGDVSSMPGCPFSLCCLLEGSQAMFRL